ncbi:hypothetical protein OIU77_006854 [Salix suchowensis]|uniref:Ankyrin repeat domain-containing protein n=1 Tax=Salix suchowensis TaxID=1278906 RepID=A0ABQ9AM35_9ROSI|nr:hypothetical protein OIU77_006854 [Salix suchowensis]
MEDFSKYAHSPAHLAVACKDYATLKGIISTLPRLAKAGEINSEEESLAAEQQADAVSSVIDRRDVPGRETPLHLAVRLRDPIAAEILMAAGADWSLQNENGWSALQEAVCTREEAIAIVIARHYQPLAWAKWCRRLPRIVASAARIRDFYMEITFHFESSVIPFIGRIAPSDTYRIWKRGSNLRADMTLAGFDGFRIQRSDQTFLFLGEGYSSEDGNISLAPGSLVVLAHKEKEVTNALEGAGAQPTEAEVAHEVALMSKTNMYRPGIDVTQAELIPNLNWRRQERTEMVGNWKAKVYDMLHVMVSVKSRRVPGAMTDEELFAVDEEERLGNTAENDEFEDVLTAEERKQLNSALLMGNSDGLGDDEEPGAVDNQGNGSGGVYENVESNGAVKEKKSWFGWKNKESAREDTGDAKKGKDKSSKKKKKKGPGSETKHESEYKKGLRPVLWLTPNFPLKTEELLPLLDILANKVKAIRRLRELSDNKASSWNISCQVAHLVYLFTELNHVAHRARVIKQYGLRASFREAIAFIQKPQAMCRRMKLGLKLVVAIPIVPTVRVLVTFTKFEELQPSEEFSTPLSSPAHFQDAKSKESEGASSWIPWMRGSRGGQSSDSDSHRYKDEIDPFLIPSDYTWVDANAKKRRMKAKKARNKKHRRGNPASQAAARGEDGRAHHLSEDVEI